MAKVFQNDHQRIVAYAAYMQLKRMLDQDGEIKPGTYSDVSFEKLEITLPKGTVVEREVGTNGDGSIYKTATQNLYGYTVMSLLVAKLKKFSQWNVLKTLILEVVREAVIKGNPTKDEVLKLDPEFEEIINAVKQEVKVQPRKESTPRLCKASGFMATLAFLGRKKTAA